MKAIQQIVPLNGTIDLTAILEKLQKPASRLTPFSDSILDFCGRFSAALFRDTEARRYPELQALAFWMRRSELLRLKAEFTSFETESTLLVPRGLVFHIPPSNVDTIFMYSWIVSVLAGNTNVIRLSARAAGASALICRLFNDTLEDSDPAVRNSIAVLRYEHDQEITAAISSACDVRVVWGGDATVETMRSFPLAPHAKELTFPDRYSLAVIRADSYLALDENERASVGTRFYNDTWWFDQMACSSPRLLIWTGETKRCEAAASEFFTHLEREIATKQYSLATGPRLNKLTFAYRAILDQPVSELRQAGPECTVLQLENLEGSLDRRHCGGGLLFQVYTRKLMDIPSVIARRDQTLTHFGFTRDELRAFVRTLNGRGIDRLVPLGQALSFHRFWDGYDLLREFTRVVYAEA